MAVVTKDEVRQYLLGRYAKEFKLRGLDPSALPEDFDLLEAGVIDSLGAMEMLASVETKWGKAIDFDGLPAEQITVLGAVSQYVSERLSS